MKKGKEKSISESTRRNWSRLKTDPEGRLTSRANKRGSLKRILPLEYLDDRRNASFIISALEYIDDHNMDIISAIYSLGTGLLRKAGLSGLPHVTEALRDYTYLSADEELASMDIPEDENDILGAVYQSYMREGKKNISGSYYTPLWIARYMTEDFDLSGGKTFLDPACGCGIFLLSVDTDEPENLWGTDVDRTAVLITRINLLLKYRTRAFIPRVYCMDYLKGDFHPLFSETFDFIATNPPWGAMEEAPWDACMITSGETFSYFFVRAYHYLKAGGSIRFLFPEAITNVKVHKDIRRFILENTELQSVTLFDRRFSGVSTGSCSIWCRKGPASSFFTAVRGDERYIVDTRSVYETTGLVFNLLSPQELDILNKVRAPGRYDLKDSTWALGIVTGDNKKKLFTEALPGTEKIYTGKNIEAFSLTGQPKYIRYNRDELQQAADDSIYRAPEKLIYKFIFKYPVFAYDDTGALFLNSANILIPEIPGMSLRTVMAFLNSSLYRFLYLKLFGEVKILKGNLSELPFPEITEEDDRKLSALAEQAMEGGAEALRDIDEYMAGLFGLSEEEAAYVEETVRMAR